jgi:hypothetical protein
MPEATHFHGEIRVASRIIDHLSSGLYHSPAACLKELINNSFDADATRVDVFVKPDADRIIIEDDGVGMNRQEFETHFSRISESHKRDKETTTESGRQPIGKIGIGFIAANEICDVMEVFSTKKGSRELLHVSINFGRMREPLEHRRRGDVDIAKADYEGEVLVAPQSDHYTKVFLKSVRGEARDILAGAKPQGRVRKPNSLYGLNAKSIAERLRDSTLRTWKDFDPYSETMLGVALNVPVKYQKNWMPEKLRPGVVEFERAVRALGFDVFYDGSELRKPVVLDPHGAKCLIRSFDFRGEHVAARGYFYAQHGTIKPVNLQGLLVRVRQAAVGEYDPSFWGFSPSEASLMQNWLSVEVWADDQLEDAMNIDRRTFREVHPAYVELRKAIHAELHEVLSTVRSELYEAGSATRNRQRLKKAKREFSELTRELPPAARRRAAKLIEMPSGQQQNARSSFLLRKYSATEVFRAASEAAEGLLNPTQLAEFLQRLASKLGR